MSRCRSVVASSQRSAQPRAKIATRANGSFMPLHVGIFTDQRTPSPLERALGFESSPYTAVRGPWRGDDGPENGVTGLTRKDQSRCGRAGRLSNRTGQPGSVAKKGGPLRPPRIGRGPAENLSTHPRLAPGRGRGRHGRRGARANLCRGKCGRLHGRGQPEGSADFHRFPFPTLMQHLFYTNNVYSKYVYLSNSYTHIIYIYIRNMGNASATLTASSVSVPHVWPAFPCDRLGNEKCVEAVPHAAFPRQAGGGWRFNLDAGEGARSRRHEAGGVRPRT